MARRTLHLVKTLAFLVTVRGHFTKGHKRTPYILWDFFYRYRQNLIFGVSVTRIPGIRCLDSFFFFFFFDSF